MATEDKDKHECDDGEMPKHTSVEKYRNKWEVLQGQGFQVQTVETIEFCPFCGINLEANVEDWVKGFEIGDGR